MPTACCIRPHPAFRLFATANTIGLGDASGLYHGTQQINQGQMDRWNIVVKLNYLSVEQEVAIVLAKVPALNTDAGKKDVTNMVKMAGLIREGFKAGDMSTVMSPRSVIAWAENWLIFGDREQAFRVSFMNKCDDPEWPILNEYYQRCFGVEVA
jgi:cobaltochelatase CobS